MTGSFTYLPGMDVRNLVVKEARKARKNVLYRKIFNKVVVMDAPSWIDVTKDKTVIEGQVWHVARGK